MTTVDMIILIAIFVSFVLGLYRGFFATVLSAASTIAAFVGSLTAADMLKVPLGTAIAPYMEKSVLESVPELTQTAQTISEQWNGLSLYMQNLLTQNGITLDGLESMPDVEGAQKELTSAIAQSAAETLAYFAVLLASFILIKLLFHFLIRITNVLTKLPVLHSCNALLGGVLGAACALVLCVGILWALKLVAPAMYSDVGILSPSVMRRSPVASTLVGWNDGVSLYDSAA